MVVSLPGNGISSTFQRHDYTVNSEGNGRPGNTRKKPPVCIRYALGTWEEVRLLHGGTTDGLYKTGHLPNQNTKSKSKNFNFLARNLSLVINGSRKLNFVDHNKNHKLTSK